MKQKMPVLIFGSGDVSRETAYLIEEINASTPQWEIIGFVAESAAEVGRMAEGYPVICTDADFLSKARQFSQLAVAIPMSAPEIKQKIFEKIKSIPNLQFPNWIHPQINVRNLQLGMGNIIQENVSVSIGVTLGNFNLINYAAFLGHDAQIADFCTINPQAKICGRVEVASQSLVGVGATILQGLKLAEKVIVGAGAVVTKDVTADQTVIGIPARPVGNM